MLHLGADLIRTSGQLRERLEALAGPEAVRAVANTEKSPDPTLDEQTNGALLRFARFVREEKKKKTPTRRSPPLTSPARNPYQVADDRESSLLFSRGQSLDIYA